MTQNTRPIYVCDNDAARLHASLVTAFGRAALEKRLKQVNKEITSEKGAYLREWVLPRNRLWLGLRELEAGARSGRANPRDVNVKIALEVSAVLEKVGNPVLASRSQSWPHRLVSEDQTSPILFEMKTAAGLWQAGYDIQWEDTGPQLKRSCEFVAVGSDVSLEVECKSQSADAGRKVTRPQFYHLLDELCQTLAAHNLVGSIDVLVPERMPGTTAWRHELVSTSLAMAARGAEVTQTLPDGTTIRARLLQVGNLVLPPSDLDSDLEKWRAPFAHAALFSYGQSGAGDRRIVVRVRSASEDHCVDAIYGDLKDAARQFTGTRAAVVFVFLPEVASFEGLQSGSSIARMTERYFRHNARPSIQSVDYLSDGQLLDNGLWLQDSSPALVFHNPCYDDKFGPRIKLLS